jgi:hypothetical protein
VRVQQKTEISHKTEEHQAKVQEKKEQNAECKGQQCPVSFPSQSMSIVLACQWFTAQIRMLV